jgi:hypothetical protein
MDGGNRQPRPGTDISLGVYPRPGLHNHLVPGPLPGPTNIALQPAMSAMKPLRLALAQSTVDPTLISAWSCLEIYIRAPYPPHPTIIDFTGGGGFKRLSRAVPVSLCLSQHHPTAHHPHPRPSELKSWHPLSSLSLSLARSLTRSLSEAVLPDRALCLPIFGHFLIVNKTSRARALSLSLSLSLFLSLFLSLMSWHPLSIYDARRRNCPIH